MPIFVPAPGRFVDLELRFMTSERPSRTAALVWVEVKHGTDPHSEQIVGDPESAALLRRQYRPGHWAAPKDTTA